MSALPQGRIREYIDSLGPAQRTGGLAVIAALARHGAQMAFGIPGTHNLEFYRHLEPLGIRAVTPRHEQGAGYAADGYYQVTGRPGVVITTSGPGLTNAITAAATAYAESRPMVLVSPGMPLGTEGQDMGQLHETKDSSGALSRLLVWSRRVRTAEAAAQAVVDAFEEFGRKRPGPVHIEVPLDVLEGPWLSELPEPAVLPEPVVAPAPVAEAADLLRAARTPMIVAGGGARGAAAELRAVAERLGAPVATTANGKGVLPEDHPLSLGANVRLAAVQDASREADVLLVIGSELADSDLWGGRIGAHPGQSGPRVIRIDIDPDQMHKNLRSDVLLCTDAQAGLRAVLGQLGETTAQSPSDDAGSGPAERAASLRQRMAGDFDLDGILPEITRIVQDAAGDDVIIAGDSSQVTYDGTVHALVARGCGQLLYMPGYATLGYGLPAAIGAKLGAPERPVAAIVGDGAAMFAVQEIMTAVELELPVLFLVVDNGGYKEIEAQMDERDIPHIGVRLRRPDFAALGTAMGAHGVALSATAPQWREQLGTAVREALAADGPTVLGLTL